MAKLEQAREYTMAGWTLPHSYPFGRDTTSLDHDLHGQGDGPLLVQVLLPRCKWLDGFLCYTLLNTKDTLAQLNTHS